MYGVRKGDDILNNIFHDEQNKYMYSGRKVDYKWVSLISSIIKQSNIDMDDALDIGCGGGIYTNQLSEFGFKHVLGIDQSEVMIASANEQAYNNHIQFEVGDIFNNNLANQSQNFILSRALIHHIQDLQKAFLETKRILKDNSIFVIQDRTIEDLAIPASSNNLRGYLYEHFSRLRDFDSKRRHSEVDVTNALYDVGFNNVETLKINEIRQSYATIESLQHDYLSRKGRSILFELSDQELKSFVAQFPKYVGDDSPIIEKDQWTLWVAYH